jgi:hypothetical protein
LQYIEDISLESCSDDMHKYKHYKVDSNTKFDKLTSNGTKTFSHVSVGHLTSSGYCKGGYYSSDGISYEGVVVQMVVSITLADYYTDVLIILLVKQIAGFVRLNSNPDN